MGEATNRVQRPFLARKVCVWKHPRPRAPTSSDPHVQRQRENCRSSEEAWDPWIRGWKELPVKTMVRMKGFLRGLYIYIFIHLYYPHDLYYKYNTNTHIFQNYKIRKHFLHLSFSAPYPKKSSFAPWLGFSAKNNLELGHTGHRKKKRLLKEGEPAIKSSQPYQGRVRWMSYHDQPLRRLDVEPGWCTLLRSLRAIEDAWHFAKPLGTLGVVLLLAGRCREHRGLYTTWKVDGASVRWW